MSYQDKQHRLVEALTGARTQAPLGLRKDSSNLFRDRREPPKHRLDVRAFNQVIEVNTDQGWVDVEGMTPYDTLVAACLSQGVMPTVVPQLKSITIGGAAAGVGIESSSFRYGLVHETLLEMDILLPDGRVVLARPDNEHRELFYGFPNSYGTLGYALRLKVQTIPVKPFVGLRHIAHSDPRRFFRDLEQRCGGDADFIDGVVFDAERMFISEGRFLEQAPYTSDYSFEHIYYRSIPARAMDYLRTQDYLWRWDTDWFWCSKNLGLQQPLLRRLVGRERLNSRFYTKVMRWNSRWGLSRGIERLLGRHLESVIQDVELPIERAPEFLDFLRREIGILPIWICPIRPYRGDVRFPLYPLNPTSLYVNFGFWDVVRRPRPFPPGHHNRLVELEVAALGGMKSLYSDAYYPEEEFWRLYDRAAYQALKTKYDPQAVLKDLYRKCVLRE